MLKQRSYLGPFGPHGRSFVVVEARRHPPVDPTRNETCTGVHNLIIREENYTAAVAIASANVAAPSPILEHRSRLFHYRPR